MKRIFVRLLKLVGLILAIPICLLLGLVAFDLWHSYRFSHDSPLAAGTLGHAQVDIEQDFQRRVREAFPLGTSVDTMVAALGDQGFTRRRGQVRSGPAMVLEHSRFPCREYWEVFWKADASGAILDVDADLQWVCL